MNQSLSLTHCMTQAPARHFWIRHGLLPLLLFVGAQALIEALSLDLMLGDWLYRLEGHAWTWRHHWLTEGLIHAGGRQFSLALLGLVLLGLALSWRVPALSAWRPGLAYLASAVLTSIALVSLGKRLTQQDCPWSLIRYGADRTYHSLFSALPDPTGGGCFPAGHASAGYAWLALYFVCRHHRPQHCRLALLPGLALGLTFGISQQLRGAHFLSHDLWTLAISWFSALLLYRWLLQRRPLGHNPHAGRMVLPATVAETGAWTPNESAGRRR